MHAIQISGQECLVQRTKIATIKMKSFNQFEIVFVCGLCTIELECINAVRTSFD